MIPTHRLLYQQIAERALNKLLVTGFFTFGEDEIHT